MSSANFTLNEFAVEDTTGFATAVPAVFKHLDWRLSETSFATLAKAPSYIGVAAGMPAHLYSAGAVVVASSSLRS